MNVYNTLEPQSCSGTGKTVRPGHGNAYGHPEMGSDFGAYPQFTPAASSSRQLRKV